MTSRLRIAPIVEGHAEVSCIGDLLRRIWYELLGGEYLDVRRPVRQPQGTLLQPDGLARAVQLALKSFDPPSNDPALVLILIDSEGECPRFLGPKLRTIASQVDPRADVACVVAHVMYETWFVASSEHLGAFLDLRPGDPPAEPEKTGSGASWIADRIKAAKYNKRIHVPRMTAAMNLKVCQARSPSFAKLCRELKKRMAPSGPRE